MKSIAYYDDCTSEERYARDWVPDAACSHDTDDNSYRITKAVGYGNLGSIRGRLPKHDKYQVKFKLKLMQDYAGGSFRVLFNVGSGISRGAGWIIDSVTPSAYDGKIAWSQYSGSTGAYSTDTGVTDGEWHDIHVVLHGDKEWSLWVDGTQYHDHAVPALPEYYGWANSHQLGFSVYKCDVKVKDIEILPLTLDVHDSDTPMEVVEVGNRRFLCERVEEYATEDTPPDLADWTLLGNTPPTVEGDHINFYDDTNAANKTSYMSLDSVLKVPMRLLWVYDFAVQPDDTDVDQPCTAHLYTSGTNSYVSAQPHPTLGQVDIQVTYAGTILYRISNASFALLRDGTYQTMKLAIYRNSYLWDLDGYLYEAETKLLPDEGHQGPRFYCRHDAGQISHVHVKNIKFYRIISEVLG